MVSWFLHLDAFAQRAAQLDSELSSETPGSDVECGIFPMPATARPALGFYVGSANSDNPASMRIDELVPAALQRLHAAHQ